MASLLVLNGPNLNLLGSREPEIYGADTLDDINMRLGAACIEAGHSFDSFQSSSEGALIDRIHAAKDARVDIIIANFGAYTHTSIALRDALLAVEIPFIEVHLSNLYAREEFRQHSFFSDIAVGCVIGLGAQGYQLALDAALARLG
jgi:3-dehydroquinate dehydratase-2